MTKNKLLRMDNVLLVVEDLQAAIWFFTELSLELEIKTTGKGEWVDRIVGAPILFSKSGSLFSQ
jgi:hypothetical protein